MSDPVNRPSYYAQVAVCPGCGGDIEAIDITERHPFARGNALKYLLRAGRKSGALTDLKKAAWYIQREIAAIEREDRE